MSEELFERLLASFACACGVTGAYCAGKGGSELGVLLGAMVAAFAVSLLCRPHRPEPLP